MEATTKKQINNLDIYQKRIEILVGARFKETDKISSALEVQDRLRKKIGHWHGAEEIKKWRIQRN
ncbi:hypothetical protein HZC30_07945 [Candidatus Woesearchaeota archaeon]|nr:hypothetical protein [Candidatus Woesearchaeota archaeon]